jgi:phenylacetate-coenzyme A ligase PaaK-like adenylate-forming protein
MPLLRYRIGDFGDSRDEPCVCGRHSSWIDSVAGREVDVLELPSGRRVSPYVLINHSIDTTREILKHQFVQTAPDRLEIQVVLAADGRGINELQYLAQELAVRLDGEMDVTMVDVDRIPRTSGGKHRVLIRAADSGVQ